jgi:hypothetical protein
MRLRPRDVRMDLQASLMTLCRPTAFIRESRVETVMIGTSATTSSSFIRQGGAIHVIEAC